MNHRLKIWPADFEAVRTGRKTCEVRRCDDRKFAADDVLELFEFDPNDNEGRGKYTGRLVRVRVTHVDRLAGPRMLVAVGRGSVDDAVPCAAISFRSIT